VSAERSWIGDPHLQRNGIRPAGSRPAVATSSITPDRLTGWAHRTPCARPLGWILLTTRIQERI